MSEQTPAPAKTKLATKTEAPAKPVEDLPPPAPFRVRLREDYEHTHDGSSWPLVAGHEFSSQDRNVDAMLKGGAQLDLIDDDGDVLSNLNEG